MIINLYMFFFFRKKNNNNRLHYDNTFIYYLNVTDCFFFFFFRKNIYLQKYTHSCHNYLSFNVIRYHIKSERQMKINKNSYQTYFILNE